MDIREAGISAAINDYHAGIYRSQRAAAKAYGIPPSTLRDRINGATNSAISHQYQQRLIPQQEDFLVQWILEEEARGYPPSHARVREMANRILRINGESNPIGQAWIPGFIRRNPRVASIVGKRLEAPRAEAATPEQIRAFLELFEATRIRLNIRLEDIYNMDETGIALGVCTNSRVLGDARKKKAYVKSPENREWVSIIESISADGRKLQCLVIFKGKNLQTTWFPSESVPDWFYTTSENGWTSQSIGLEWLQRIFIPQTDTDPQRYRLLILDGHGSHIDTEFLYACKTRKIELLFLPPHSTHILQPLDLTPFSVVKSKYRRQIQDLATLDDAAPVKKERFIACYNQAREEGLSDRKIRAGWKAAGLSPFNIDHVLGSSQILGRPVTPPSQNQLILSTDTLYRTPQGPRDVYDAQQSLQRSENLSRTTRLILQKAGKAISTANTRAARLEADNRRLKYQLDCINSTRPRKRIQLDPNQKFADIENIMSAINQSAAEQAQKSSYATGEGAAAAAAAVAAAATLQSMCIEFQI